MAAQKKEKSKKKGPKAVPPKTSGSLSVKNYDSILEHLFRTKSKLLKSLVSSGLMDMDPVRFATKKARLEFIAGVIKDGRVKQHRTGDDEFLIRQCSECKKASDGRCDSNCYFYCNTCWKTWDRAADQSKSTSCEQCKKISDGRCDSEGYFYCHECWKVWDRKEATQATEREFKFELPSLTQQAPPPGREVEEGLQIPRPPNPLAPSELAPSDFARASTFIKGRLDRLKSPGEPKTTTSALRIRLPLENVGRGEVVIGKQLPGGEPVLLNTKEPFTMMCLGKQGSGKSNSVAKVLEAHLLPSTHSPTVGVAAPPIQTLILHYSGTTECEFIGLCDHREVFDRTTILVSPADYKRFCMYQSAGFSTVKLKFDWGQLGAEQLLALMMFDATDPPLYSSTMLTYLRGFQARGRALPPFWKFKEDFLYMLLPNQKPAAELRLTILEPFLADSAEDVTFESLLRHPHASNVIVDLSDPLLMPADAGALFYCLVNMFRRVDGPKMVVLDEAHKYLQSHQAPLCREIVNTIEMMRHDGIRVIISTQVPEVIPINVFQLVTVTFIHRIQSPDAWAYLCHRLPLTQLGLKKVLELEPGECVVFPIEIGSMKVDRRKTSDLGETQS